MGLFFTDDYTTHKYTKKQKLNRNPVTINISRINKKNKVVQNVIYKVPFLVKRKAHKIPFHGITVNSRDSSS